VTLWDAHTGQERLMCQAGRTTWVFCVQFSPDGALVAQTTDYGTILLWDVATGALHASLKGHTSSVNCVAFHPDGKTLASASTDKTVKLWDVATGQERITLVGHDGPVQSVAFAPDGNTLASGSTDGAVKLWRAATDREAVAPRTEREPDEPDSFFAMINQGDMLHRSGQSEAAEQIYHKAASRLEKLTAAFPKEPEYRRDMALTDYTLGSMFKTDGRIPEAEEAYHRVRVVMEKLAADFPKEALSRGDRLHSQWYRIDLSQAAGRRPEAEYRAYGANVHRNLAIDLARRGKHSEAMDAYREAMGLEPDNPLAQNNLAWLLATCPEHRFRDPVKAVALAKKAVELTPKQGIFWNTLGTAYYRAGDWKAAIEALNMSMDLRNGGDAFDWFFLAMAHWQQGDKKEARRWYDRAVAWMDQNAAQDEELRGVRAEAGELLGIGKTKD
jgi:eukaryotic-like serine/threonine-protein kinase